MTNQKTENFNFPIPNEVLEPYIKEAVSASIVGALGDQGRLIEVAVQRAIALKVNSEGNVSRYSSDNKHHLIDVIAQKNIQKITKEVVNEMAEQMREPIGRAVKDQILSHHSEIAQTLVNGLIDSLKTTWNIKVSITGRDTE